MGDCVRIYTVWAALKEDLSGTWMIWACTEWSYEGDPDGQDAELATLKAKQGDGVEFREITLLVPLAEIDAAFTPREVEVRTDAKS